jgi:hypothetical protein
MIAPSRRHVATSRPLARALVIAFLLSLPTFAQAQVITLTAGEHVGFTRLVLQARERFAWRVELGPQRATLRLPPGAEFRGINQLFDRIPRDRLAALRSEPGLLDLVLVCDCPLSVWEDREGLVIIDIASPPAIDTETSAPAPPPPPNDSTDPPPATPPAAATGAELRADLARLAGNTLARDRRLAPAPDPGAGADAAMERQLLDRLAREVARAQTQGVLHPALEGGVGPRAIFTLPETTEISEPPLPHLRIANVLERAGAEALRAGPNPDEVASCNGTQALDFLARERQSTFPEGQSWLLAQAYGEFDLPNPDIHMALVELYLDHAMGAEARAVIDLGLADGPGSVFLRALADLLEGRASNALPHLAAAAECSDITLAIAIASGAPGLGLDPTVAARAVLGFGLLGPQVRSALGPGLIEGLIAAGEGATARLVIDALRHDPDLAPAVLQRLEARIETALGSPDRAAAHLIGPSETDAAALRDRLALAREAGLAPPTDLLDHAEAMAATLRHSQLGGEIALLAAELRARSGDLDGAFAALDRLWAWARERPSLRPDVMQVQAEIWHSVAQTPSDAAFLGATLARADWHAADIPAPTLALIMDRLAGFGLREWGAAEVARAQDLNETAETGASTPTPPMPPAPVAGASGAAPLAPQPGEMSTTREPPAATAQPTPLPGRPPAPQDDALPATGPDTGGNAALVPDMRSPAPEAAGPAVDTPAPPAIAVSGLQDANAMQQAAALLAGSQSLRAEIDTQIRQRP